ncbi:peptidyl-tRNA hydrolase, PTH2 family [Trypanosoma cruzi]|nr:peptidyl-tRNA hydrolase, PTH2 family [Trypanosoma cruzi]
MYTSEEAQTTGDVAGTVKHSLFGFFLGYIMVISVDLFLRRLGISLRGGQIPPCSLERERQVLWGSKHQAALPQHTQVPSSTPRDGQEEEWSTEDEDEEEEEEEDTSDCSSEFERIEDLRLKMVLVIRRDVKEVSPNEIFTLSAGAAVSLVQKVQRDAEHREWKSWYEWWRRVGCAKIALQSPDNRTLRKVALAAEANGLPWYGATSLSSPLDEADAGEQTGVLVAVGPAPSALLDPITGKLKLLS